MCLKKYIENYESPWKCVMDFYLKKVGGKCFNATLIIEHYSITLPIFCRECLQAWSSMTDYDSSSYDGIMNNESNYLEQQVYFK